MFSYSKRFIVAALIALAPCLSLTAEAGSPRRPPPHRGPQHRGPGAGAQDSGGGQTGSVSISEANPADLVNALTHAYEMEMSRKLTYEQLKRERLETKRLLAEYERQERENTPSLEAQRQLAKIAELHRSLDPPVYEIHSATALNVLLEDLQPFHYSNGKGPQVLLDEDWLGHFNVISTQDRSGNTGVLKNEGRLSWPSPLREAEYQVPRNALNVLAPQAIKQAVDGGVQPETLRDMREALGQLNGRLAANIKNLPPPRHIESKRYLGELNEAMKLLEKPHAGNYFNGKFSAQGKTVADLIRHMSKHGLRFAPAVAGDEAAYENLHRALAVYDVAAHYSQSKEQ